MKLTLLCTLGHEGGPDTLTPRHPGPVPLPGFTPVEGPQSVQTEFDGDRERLTLGGGRRSPRAQECEISLDEVEAVESLPEEVQEVLEDVEQARVPCLYVVDEEEPRALAPVVTLRYSH